MSKVQIPYFNVSNVSNLKSFIPEPKNGLSLDFKSILNKTFEMARDVSFGGINSEYQQILNQQLEVQKQMMLVSLQSNLLKSKHEISMSVIRNVRAS